MRIPDPEIWQKLAGAVKEAEPEPDRSAVIRQFIRWYTGKRG